MLVAYVSKWDILVVNADNEVSFLHDNFYWYQVGNDPQVHHGIGLKDFQDYERKECEGRFMTIRTSPSVF